MKGGRSYMYTLIQCCLPKAPNENSINVHHSNLSWLYWVNHNSNMEWGKSWITCLWTCNKCQMQCSICTLCGWYAISGSGSDNFHVYGGGSKCIKGNGIIGHDVYDCGITNDIMIWSWSQWCCYSLSFL
jgi:hypothetical protein